MSTTPRQIRRGISLNNTTGGGADSDQNGDVRSPKTSGTSSTLMRGVNGDVKEAFGKLSCSLRISFQMNSNHLHCCQKQSHNRFNVNQLARYVNL